MATIPTKSSKTNAKFLSTRARDLARAKQFVKAYESSSSDSEENDRTSLGSEIYQNVFKGYGGDIKELAKTQHFLENVLQSSAATCLICIGNVRRADQIWSCGHCYCFVHLACIQRWANDSLAQKQMSHEAEAEGYFTNAGEYIPKKALILNWNCPQCRTEFDRQDIPREYNCFCGRETNPEAHPWQLPHSCGEVCGRALRPECGHRCVLLCHPGPCPPCPQMISKGCDCGQSGLKTIRCATRKWQCGKRCQRALACGLHQCNGPCHSPAECKPCPKKAVKSCLCGRHKEERNCDEIFWQCKEICENSFDCGRHQCLRQCHSGPCGKCNRPRTCPCGKQQQSTDQDCSEQIDSCGDTCLKELDCGEHLCLDRCHKGSCSKCKEIVEQKCRCGLHSKEMACSKQFTCETKCKRMRSCKLHLCNRKCCDGVTCPPCDKVCNKSLSCTKHKCKSMCHTGPCYPCTLKANLKCRCGGTVIEVPCGRARKTKPPKCQLPCRRPSKCHHQNIHTCHDNDCPPCTKICNMRNDTTGCDHPCQAKCHDSVLMKRVDKNFKPSGPWDMPAEIVEFQKLPHPRCEQKVSVACLGEHETIPWPCWDAVRRTCGRACGHPLACGNHKCDKICHDINTSECGQCSKACSIARQPGCDHPCRKPCHTDLCQPCIASIKSSCHCGLMPMVYKCSEVAPPGCTKEDVERNRNNALSCSNRCIKNYPCGHRCTEKCHSGPCPMPENCRKKVKVACDCKMRKAEVACIKLRTGTFHLACDENCKVKQAEQRQVEEEQQRIQKEAEEEKNRREVEVYQQKYGNKKPRERRHRPVTAEEANPWKRIIIIGAITLSPILGGVIYYFFT